MRVFFQSIFIGLLSLGATAAWACTSFRVNLGNEQLLAKSYDWHLDSGVLLTNPRGLSKSSLVLRPGGVAARWTSKYGSLTVNQHGRELPLGGLNEAGLGIEILWLSSTEDEPADQRPTVNELQWIQYQLDNYATVADVVKNLSTVRIERVHAKVHYLVCDTQGECATVELLGKQWKIHTGVDLKVAAITNDTYAASWQFLTRFKGFGGGLDLPASMSSLDRFVRAAALAKQVPAEVNPVDGAFGVLESVFVEDYSQFNFVYELAGQKAHFRTAREMAKKTVSLAALAAEGSWDCQRPPKFIDLHHARAGAVAVAEFSEYTAEKNFAWVSAGIEGVLPEAVLKSIAKYPQSFVCN